MSPQHHSHSPQRTVLVRDDHAGQYVQYPRRPWYRLLAEWRSLTLDHELARGYDPDGSRLRAVRAAALVAPSARAQLASCWQRLLERAARPAPARGAHPVLAGRQILAAEPDIRELIAALTVTRPVPARGAALANLLLIDGGGPVYRARSPHELDSAVREAIRHLDPGARLIPAGA
jgi:hypothetical protein